MNEIEIRVTSKDQTAHGFASAEQRSRKLAASVAGGPGSVADAFGKAEKSAGGFGGSLRRIGEIAAGVLAADLVRQMAQRAKALIDSTVKAASDLGESVNAVNKVFGESSEQVLAWGKANANAIGLSQRAFNQAATPLGSMLKNQGLELEQVTNHTQRLTERAADMASVFNTDVMSALTAIQAGLRGEIDPLERYGVSLSAVAVEAKALAETGKQSAKELTNQEKALARLNLIYEQTADTAGDFRDTSDGLANSQRIATATIEDAKAKIGTVFIPVMAKAAQLSGEFAGTIAGLPQPVILVTAAIVGLAAATVLLIPRIMATKVALEEMGLASAHTTGTLVAMGRAVGVLGLALVGLKIGEQIGPLKAAGDAADNFAVKIGMMNQEAADNKTLFDQVFGNDGWLQNWIRGGPPAYGGLVKIASGIKEVGKEAKTAVPSVDELDKSFKSLIDTAFGFEEAQDAAAESVSRLKEQLKQQRDEHVKGAGSLTGNTQAARDNRAAVRDLTSDYGDMIIEAQKAGKSTGNLQKELEDQLVAMGFSRIEAKKYTDQLAILRGQIDLIKSKEVTVRVKVEQSRRFGQGDLEFAHGGIIGAASGGVRGGRVMVGERGRELVDLPYGSRVHPNGTTEAMMAGGGGGVARLEVGGTPSGPLEALFMEWLINSVAKFVGNKGGRASVLGIRT